MHRRHVRIRVQTVLLIAVTVFTAVNPPAARAAPNTRILAAAKACEPDARALLQQLVQIDSGTGDGAGLAAVATIAKTELERLGASVENVSAVAPAVGDNLVATLTGTGRGRILLIAHMDTVFAHGAVAQRPYAVIGDHGIGPGLATTRAGWSARYAHCASCSR